MIQPDPSRVGAVVLAAGESKRMGRPKMTLAWGDTTVIGRVVEVFNQAGVEEIIVVTGGARQEVEKALAGYPARLAFNPNYPSGEMLSSLQIGLRELSPGAGAAVVALGDQPQVQVGVVKSLLSVYRSSQAQLVVPSFQRRRGHPWLVGRPLWPAVYNLLPPATLRDFLHLQAENIYYLPVDTSSVLADLDTPEDYQRQRPEQKADG